MCIMQQQYRNSPQEVGTAASLLLSYSLGDARNCIKGNSSGFSAFLTIFFVMEISCHKAVCVWLAVLLKMLSEQSPLCYSGAPISGQSADECDKLNRRWVMFFEWQKTFIS